MGNLTVPLAKNVSHDLGVVLVLSIGHALDQRPDFNWHLGPDILEWETHLRRLIKSRLWWDGALALSGVGHNLWIDLGQVLATCIRYSFASPLANRLWCRVANAGHCCGPAKCVDNFRVIHAEPLLVKFSYLTSTRFLYQVFFTIGT